MSDADALNQLKRLAAVKDFKSDDYYFAWAEEVDTYLPYSSHHFQQAFRRQLRIVKESHEGDGEASEAIDRMAEIVDEAIDFLGEKIGGRPTVPKTSNTPTPKSEALKLPEKVTLFWLLQHVSIGQWFGFFTFLAVLFGLGISFGRSPLYESLTKQAAPSSEQAPKSAKQ